MEKSKFFRAWILKWPGASRAGYRILNDAQILSLVRRNEPILACTPVTSICMRLEFRVNFSYSLGCVIMFEPISNVSYSLGYIIIFDSYLDLYATEIR